MGRIRNHSGIPAATNKEKADNLLGFFHKLHRVDNGTKPSRIEAPETPVMGAIEVTADMVATALSKLNATKAAGPDGIHPAMLKPLAQILAGPLSQLFNLSLGSAILPLDWKDATVTPIHKGGDRDEASNYRPVSLTSVVLKVLERIIRDAIAEHYSNYKMLSANQHGFVRRRSCLTNLICFMDEITKKLDRGRRLKYAI